MTPSSLRDDAYKGTVEVLGFHFINLAVIYILSVYYRFVS